MKIDSLTGKSPIEILAFVERQKESLSARDLRKVKKALRSIRNDRSLGELRDKAYSLWKTLLAGEKKSIPLPTEPKVSRNWIPEKKYGPCDNCANPGQLFWPGWDDPETDDLLELLRELDGQGHRKRRLCAICWGTETAHP
jgi:hypothetical protein